MARVRKTPVERALRRQARAEAMWDPRMREVQDQSWMKWYRCRICGFRCCANNNQRREIRPHRVGGVPVCHQRGCAEAVLFYRFTRRVADQSCVCLDFESCIHAEASAIMAAVATGQIPKKPALGEIA